MLGSPRRSTSGPRSPRRPTSSRNEARSVPLSESPRRAYTSRRGEPAMNMELKAPLRAQKSKVEIVDCDFHPKITFEQLKPHLSQRWWQYLQTYGIRQRHAYAKGFPFPKATPQAARRDAWPPSGGLPASDIDFTRRQHLDFYGIGHAIMNPLSPSGLGEQNADFSAAMAAAANEAQVESWVAH